MILIFTPNLEAKGVGVFDNGTDQMIVEVYNIRKEIFSFAIDGNRKTNISRPTPEESWQDAADYLGATLVKVFDKKDLKPYDVYKQYFKTQKQLKAQEQIDAEDRQKALDKENGTASLFNS